MIVSLPRAAPASAGKTSVYSSGPMGGALVAEVPEELAAAGFKFARQKSKLAGVIRGSFFVIKGDY